MNAKKKTSDRTCRRINPNLPRALSFVGVYEEPQVFLLVAGIDKDIES